jgi:hypothetical protein
MLESRVVLAMIIRRFNFKEVYGELDHGLGRTVKALEGV